MNSIWTSEDTKRAILFSLVPGALSLYANVSFRKEENLSGGWSFAINKPNWAPENPAIYGFIDGVTIAPLGLASYMAYKYGGGLAHNDTKLALTLYGGSMICAFLTMPLVKKKSSHSIHRCAGLLMVPYVL
uniref:Bm9837, isoform a n=1 Tax=Brugia malayi TaxID=6279 RepID=A0A0J9Y9E6_BRUMA|nr:Bm9837, isoform a [Brugia malayi]